MNPDKLLSLLITIAILALLSALILLVVEAVA